MVGENGDGPRGYPPLTKSTGNVGANSPEKNVFMKRNTRRKKVSDELTSTSSCSLSLFSFLFSLFFNKMEVMQNNMYIFMARRLALKESG